MFCNMERIKNKDMNLTTILSDYNIRKGIYYPYEIDTPIGTLQLNLNDNMLFTNFIDFEEKAKLVQGHWKNNAYVSSPQDIIIHVQGILYGIQRYKEALRTGDFNYK